MKKSKIKQQENDAKKVLVELQRNSRQDLDTLSKHCKCSRQKIWRIIKQLESSGFIWGYTAIVDEDKRNTTQFTVLIKKATNPLAKQIMDKIDSITLEEFVTGMEVAIESSYFVHGAYDWVISIITSDIKQARKFCEALYKSFPGAIERIEILQTLYAVRKHYVFNPDRKKLHDLM